MHILVCAHRHTTFPNFCKVEIEGRGFLKKSVTIQFGKCRNWNIDYEGRGFFESVDKTKNPITALK